MSNSSPTPLTLQPDDWPALRAAALRYRTAMAGDAYTYPGPQARVQLTIPTPARERMHEMAHELGVRPREVLLALVQMLDEREDVRALVALTLMQGTHERRWEDPAPDDE